MRIWIDRAFTVVGAGTVVTGTVAAGTVRVGDELELLGARGTRRVTVRGLQRHSASADAVGPVSRVALNLRGVAVDEIHRGDALLTPGQWRATGVVDVRVAPSDPDAAVPVWLTVHAGTAAVPARVRPFDGDHARLTLSRELPLVLGDPLVLRDPGRSGSSVARGCSTRTRRRCAAAATAPAEPTPSRAGDPPGTSSPRSRAGAPCGAIAWTTSASARTSRTACE